MVSHADLMNFSSSSKSNVNGKVTCDRKKVIPSKKKEAPDMKKVTPSIKKEDPDMKKVTPVMQKVAPVMKI